MQAAHGPAPITSSISLVTGAGGFIARHLRRHLTACAGEIRLVSSRPGIDAAAPPLLEQDEATLSAALEGVDRVYFAAGIAHEAAAGDRELMWDVNVDAPVRWLRAADQAGVARFIWLSSIKVLGDRSERPLEPSDPYRPGDDYARSKAQAEQRLLEQRLAATSLAIVRPPLVYGPGVRGNFAALLRLADSRWPLPLGRALAPRSLVAVDNLCDLLVRLGSGGEGIFHVGDGDDVSVATLVTELRRLLGRAPRLVSVAPALVRVALTLAGRADAYQRLFEPLQVSIDDTRSRLDWAPPRPSMQALADTVTWLRTLR